MWERNGQELEVALYVRAVRKAEHPKAPTAALTAVIRMQEALGLSLPGLARNHWRIADVPAAAPAGAAGRAPARSRFKVVTGGAG
jgi:hypothetical protein